MSNSFCEEWYGKQFMLREICPSAFDKSNMSNKILIKSGNSNSFYVRVVCQTYFVSSMSNSFCLV